MLEKTNYVDSYLVSMESIDVEKNWNLYHLHYHYTDYIC